MSRILSVKAKGRAVFKAHGKFCARHRYAVLVVCALFCGLCSLGITQVYVEQDPNKLWVAPESRTAQEKKYFDDMFGPFYRTEQIILTPRGTQGSVASLAAMEELAGVLERISTMSSSGNTTQRDFCWELLPGRGCFTLSPMQYFQNNRTTLAMRNRTTPRGVAGWFAFCNEGMYDECNSDLGLPIPHYAVFGGEQLSSDGLSLSVAAGFVTILLQSREDAAYTSRAAQWEEEVFLPIVAEYAATSPYVTVDYRAERSVQDALAAQEGGSVDNVVISYVVMFVYLTCALGCFHRVHSKIFVAFSGVVIVLCSLIVSIGLCSLAGVHMTLIIAEVIPFLILAIGVDNMFIVSSAYWHASQEFKMSSAPMTHRGLTSAEVEEVMGTALGQVGGTILTAGFSEIFAFSVGALSTMPAVRSFSIYSACTVLMNVALQLTGLISILTIDALRVEARRAELVPCIGDGDSKDEEEVRVPIGVSRRGATAT